MYKISLKDVGTARVTKDITVNTDDIAIAVAQVSEEIEGLLDGRVCTVRACEKDEYLILYKRTLLGSFTIVKQ